MYIPKNAASMISDSLAQTHDEPAEPMHEMEAFGHSILQAIHAKDAKGLAETIKSFVEAACDDDGDADADASEQGESQDYGASPEGEQKEG